MIEDKSLLYNSFVLETSDLFRRGGCPKCGGVGGRVCPLSQPQIVPLVLFVSGTTSDLVLTAKRGKHTL